MPEGIGYSKDFAGDIAQLIKEGQAGDTDAQKAVLELIQKAEQGDERVAKMVDDAASRIKEGRHFPEDGPKDASTIAARLGKLTGDVQEDNSQPTEREQQLLKIIAKLMKEKDGSKLRSREEGT